MHIYGHLQKRAACAHLVRFLLYVIRATGVVHTRGVDMVRTRSAQDMVRTSIKLVHTLWPVHTRKWGAQGCAQEEVARCAQGGVARCAQWCAQGGAPGAHRTLGVKGIFAHYHLYTDKYTCIYSYIHI